jgi:hypothetical protein
MGFLSGILGKDPVTSKLLGGGGGGGGDGVSVPAPGNVTGLYGAANAWFNQTPGSYFPGSTVAGFTPEQQNAWQLQQQGAQQGANAGNQLWNSFSNQLNTFDPAGNPWLDQAVGAMRQNSQQQFDRQTAPQLQQAAITSGGLGGSRQGIAEGIARGDLNQGMMNTEAAMRNQAYGQGLNYQSSLYGMAPGQAQAASALWTGPGAVSQGIANQQLGMNQARLSDEVARWNYQRDLQAQRINQYGGMLGQIQGGTQSGILPQQQNPWTAGIGGALAGSQLGSSLSNWWSNRNQDPTAVGTPR